MEALKSDLKKILAGSAELLSRANSLQTPSWKFPEKLAVSLDVEGVLKERVNHDESVYNHFFILELVIDRLLLVLQCCVSELEGVRGHRSNSIPLTLGSTVKRLTKCIVQNSSHAMGLKEQISSLESSFSKLLQEHQSLQASLHSDVNASDSALTKQHEDSNKSCSQPLTRKLFAPEFADVSTQTTETAFAMCTQCSATQLGLLESARLMAGLCEKHSIQSSFSSCNWAALEKAGGLEVGKWCQAVREDVGALDQSICSLLERIGVLLQERDQLCENVRQLEVNSLALGSQLETLKDDQEYDKAALVKSQEEFAASLANLESIQSMLRQKNSVIQTELDASRGQVESLGTTMSKLEAHSNQLEADLHAIGKREQELKVAKKNLEDQLDSVIRQSQEALNDSQVELNKYKMQSETMEKKYEVMKNKQSSLLSQLDSLDEECANLKEELQQVEGKRQKLSSDLLQVQASYRQVQGSCEQAQKQLCSEQDKLLRANQEQDRLNSRLTSLDAQLAETKEQVEAERRNCRLLMDYPFVKQMSENYDSHITSVIQNQQSRRQITANTVRILMLEEQNNELRLKTTTSMVKEKTSASSTSKSSNKVDAPLRLWEDDVVSEIQAQQEAIRRRPGVSATPDQLQLWGHGNTRSVPQLSGRVETVEMELPKQAFAKKTRSAGTSSAPTSRPVSKQQGVQSAMERRNTRSSLKGRLGHLVAAVADAHKQSALQSRQQQHISGSGSGNLEQRRVKKVASKSPTDIEMYLCDTCDKMLYMEEDMQRHSLSCKRART